jgi:hypothetical protein
MSKRAIKMHKKGDVSVRFTREEVLAFHNTVGAADASDLKQVRTLYDVWDLLDNTLAEAGVPEAIGE